MSEWIMLPLLALACQRWWHWKREAYRTRDAAIQGFNAIRDDVTGRNS